MRPRPWLALVLAAGCRHLPPLDPTVAAQLEKGGYLVGEVAELGEPLVLDDSDFAYAVALRGAEVAFTHLPGENYQVALFRRSSPLFDLKVNPYESDVEAVDLSPDGQVVVTASRDGTVRFLATDGKPLGAHVTTEPLTSVAFHPSGRYVIAGSAKGLLTVVGFPSLKVEYEARAHADAISAIAIAKDGTVYTGGWDKKIGVFASVEPDGAPLALEPRGAFSFDSYVNDVTVDAAGRRLGVACSEVLAVRSPGVDARELSAHRPGDFGAIVDARSGQILQKRSVHHGLVSTAAISPDGETLVTGGWDNRLMVNQLIHAFGWSVRRARFSPDGRYLGVAAWTPLKVGHSEPSAVVFEVGYHAPAVRF